MIYTSKNKKKKKHGGDYPPEYYYEIEKRKEAKVSKPIKNVSNNRIIENEHIVTAAQKDNFRKRYNLRSKDHVNRTICCEICGLYQTEGYRYHDREGWIAYLCVYCAKQVGGPSGKKLIISTPMGGMNKR